MEGHCPEP
jgi:hypothetical protein